MWTRASWLKESEQKNWNQLQAERYLESLRPKEIHNVGGDCINPLCDYPFTFDDIKHMENYSGWFTCPQCGLTYNYMDDRPQKTKAGITMDEMGTIGEKIIEQMGEIPGIGPITLYNLKTNPIDAVAGSYGIEIKTNHSEAQPRFKIGGEWVYVPELGRAVTPRKSKEIYCEANGLIPALIGVRLNFYTSIADIFWREGLTDTWIGNKQLTYLGQQDFKSLNPFPTPGSVPTAAELPEDDSTPVDDIPF